MAQKERGSPTLLELAYQASLASKTYSEHPSDVTRNLEEIAFEKVSVAQRKASVLEDKKFTLIALQFRQKFVRACDAYIAEPTEENHSEVESLWATIKSQIDRMNPPPRKLFASMPGRLQLFSFAALAILFLLILVGSIKGIFSPPTNLGTVTPTAFSPNGKILNIASYKDLKPFLYSDGTGKLQGFDYDVVMEICKRLGCKATFHDVGLKDIIAVTASHTYDMGVAGIVITDARLQQVDFSTPYLKRTYILIASEGETRFKSAGEFKAGNYKLGTAKNMSDSTVAINFVGQNRVVEVPNTDNLFIEWNMGSIDAILWDSFTSIPAGLKKLDDQKALQAVQTARDVAFAFPKGSEWIAAINKTIGDMDNDNTLAKIIASYSA